MRFTDLFLEMWLVRNGFKDTSRVGGGQRFERGGLRVYAAIDEVVVIMFSGAPGESSIAWEVRFPAPNGILSVPTAVVISALAAAIETRSCGSGRMIPASAC